MHLRSAIIAVALAATNHTSSHASYCAVACEPPELPEGRRQPARMGRDRPAL
jgi:hypothetical protein